MHARKSPHCARNTHSPDTVCAPTLGVHRNRPRERETNMKQSEQLIPARPSVAIIGAGFSGLADSPYLQQAGIASFTISEKADRLGGFWRENTYPENRKATCQDKVGTEDKHSMVAD